MVFIYGYGDLGPESLNEETRVARSVPKAWLRPSVDALVDEERQVLEATQKGKIEGIVLRFGGFYGPNAGTEIMAELVRRRCLPVTKDAGNSAIPLVHIEDAGAAVITALHRGRAGEVYNIVDDESAPFADVVRYLASTIGAPRPRVIPKWCVQLLAPLAAAAWLDTRMWVSNAKAKQELQWKPRFPSYHAGIAEFWSSVKNSKRTPHDFH